MMKKDFKYDDMLIQIRQIIQAQHQSAKPLKHQHFIQRNNQNLKKSLFNIQQIIEESSKIINKNKNHNKKNNAIINGKILAANQLLKQQSATLPPFVKSYIKQKIQSEIFSISPQNRLTQQELQSFQKEKKNLVKLREDELRREKQHRAKLIKDVKQFDQSKNVKIPVHQIDSLIFNEEPSSSYLLKITPNNRNKILSQSNNVKNSNLFISQVYERQQGEEKQSIENNQMQFDEEYSLIQEQIQGGYGFDDKINMNRKLQEKLTKYPHMVKILGVFLEKQLKIMSISDQFQISADILQKQVRKSKPSENQTLMWKNKPKKFTKSLQNIINQGHNNQNISTIVQKYKFKAFIINEQSRMPIDKQIVTQKRVNKMIGESKNFHLKNCTLTKNELIYFDENDKKEMKKIQIPLQKIQVQKGLKQQGSFFSKKQQNVQIINLKGKNRNFKYEKGSLEGEQFYNETLKLMAMKVSALISKMNGSNYLDLQNFIINSKCQNLNLSNNIFRFIENQASRQQRQLFLGILCDLISLRPDIQTIQMIRSKLFPNQLGFVFKKCSTVINLKKINLSSTRLIKQSFSQLCQLVNQTKNLQKLQITLQNCKLDDQVFSSNVGVFTSFCSKVKYLNLSKNNITSKTIHIIKSCLENITSQIKFLIINDCPIKQILKLSGLMKDSRKLQYLEAQNCSLGLEKRSIAELQSFFECFKRQSNLKSLKISRNGSLSEERVKILQNFWTNQSLRVIQIDVDMKNTSNKLTLQPQLNNFGQLNFQIQRKFNLPF